MKIPKNLNIHVCSQCESELLDDNFTSCGVFMHRRALFFDYKCPACSHVGRYVFELKDGISMFDGIRSIASMLENEHNLTVTNSKKENIALQLNSIVGVTDLLKLGGTHAPTEPNRYSD